VATPCPSCGSERTRRGGQLIWTIYVVLIAAALVSVLILHLHAGLIAAIMLAIVVIANLLVEQRVCPDCGKQWTEKRSNRE
jgi:predicted RNA-binding Zn-ribbon protein involved in translation (DUF1610 family)